MKLKVTPVNENPPFVVGVKKRVRGINDFLLTDKTYRAFQYDCSERPEHYLPEYAQTRTFHGFLIGRGKNETIECYIKVEY